MTDDQKILVENMINSDRVFLMLKGTPEMPRCGFSARVVEILNGTGASYGSFNVFDDYNIMNMIKEYSNWPTIPQLYIKKEFVGGCDIIKEMNESGELLETFNTKGVETKSS